MSIGTDSTNNAINIGTAASAGRTATIGNTTGTSTLALKYGTGNFALTSATGTIISALGAGEITRPLQTAFMAFLPSNDTGATGDGTAYTLGATTALTKIIDQNSDFNTNGTFTAPVTARYALFASITYKCNSSNGGTEFLSNITTSNRTYYGSFFPTVKRISGMSSGVGNLLGNASALTDMDAADTATAVLTADGGSKTDTIIGDASISYSSFSGYLAV